MIRLKDVIVEMAAKKAVNQIKTGDRIINTNNETITFRNIQQEPPHEKYMTKPKGLWYSVGKSWLNWVRSEMPGWEGEHLFKITLTNKIIVLKNKEDCRKFQEQYGYHQTNSLYKDDMIINWQKVSTKYAGVELWNYNDSTFHWTYGWDVPSGCVWNSTGFSEIKKIELE